ncbi:hypothetical protein [Thermofilum pendens]|uniref:DUF4352 domain-containing protein n=1 Tax=Thermofilum pendens (strain DSM 2475 / Hrk 5) TaxID=368408 RepID=A1RXZ2_THEPD|nr:hypothetical protein [Thermofilum pendens]ABL78072.1 hypothetical protein Tpen_0670 [Thermofilum pendens Hrk 5]
MLIVTLSVVALIGYFLYSVASGATNRPVLVQAGDALLTGSGTSYQVIVYLQNIGSTPADLTGANITIPDLNAGPAQLTCTPALLRNGDVAKCTSALTLTSAPTSAKTAIIETKYGAIKVTLLRS